ncbi:right-handed parallel beta-helix repeat-containing protein [Halorubrum sp. Eb13]|uniref:right-handed parallel beta-helix repeat-containing protein n=1 Tax=Halorubrum sp. Eb13 TaxID=1383843 RepID=UPI000B9944E9|nr:right-handed parallel beta-helix repeat-containing protein [Halorubrum sp. Eb13]OYR39201.1 hypothetical protein DJ75_17180 [Halorubrum sp. Eb13]
MKVAGGIGLVGSAGCAAATDGGGTGPSQTKGATDPSGDYDIGGRRLVGADGYGTVAEAWADADDGDTVYVHSSYDAAEAGESFPIELDCREKQVTLCGGHPSASVIDAGETDKTVLEVVGAGSGDYQNNPLVKDLKVVGGGIGLRLRAAPFASFENLTFYRTADHAVLVDGHPDSGTFGTNWYNVQAWNCGGDGIRTDRSAAPHGTTLWGCRFTANRGAGVRFRGAACKMVGGTSQLNYDYGVETRGGNATLVSGAYVEGNARGNDFPVEVYAKRADGLTVENTYFHGINPRGAEHGHDRVQRAVNVHDSEKLTVRDCVARRYGDGFVATFGCVDADVYAASHHLEETELFARDPTRNGNARARSHGVILPTDLTAVDGACEYDRGYHVGGDGVEGHAIWRNGGWKVSETVSL